MKKLLLGLVALLILLVAGLSALVLVGPSLIDLRPRVEAAVKSATGHDFRIAGKLDISLVPALSVTVSDAHLANAKGGGDFAAIGTASLRMSWWPLLHGRIVIDSLVLDQPAVALAVDKTGAPNWLFQPEGAAKPAPATPPPAGKSAGHDIQLRALRVEQGRFTYADAVTGQTITAKDIGLTGGTIGKTDWRLAMTLNGEKVQGEFAIDSPARLLAGLPAAIDMSLKTRHLTASYKGNAQSEPQPALNGVFDLDVPSVGALFAWLDNKLAYDPGSLTMHLETTSDGGKLTLRNAAVTGKAIKLTAQAEIDATKTPPSFEAKIDIPQADIDAYLPPAPAARPGGAPAAPATAPAPAPAGWSTAPYDFSVLGGANGHLAITIGTLRYRGQDITDGTFDITLDKRVLRLTKGRLRVSGGEIAAAARFQGRTEIKDLTLRPLLAAYAGTDKLAGTLAATAQLAATGANQAQMVASLSGAGTLAIARGAVYGIDLQKSLREIGKLRLATGPGERTEFTSLTGSYTIKDGVLTNTDLRMASPLANLTGAGIVSLPPQSLDYTLQARLAPGSGVTSALSAVAIPLRISGPWRGPKVDADWSAALGQINLKALPGRIDKVAPDVNRLLPGLFRR
jgi:AsmA protein